MHEDLAALTELVSGGGVLALTGAGMSTGSGIPDYRGPTGSLRRHTPMTYGEFVTSPAGRQRYWARSYVGWVQIARERPAPPTGRSRRCSAPVSSAP